MGPGLAVPRVRPVLDLPASAWRNGRGSTRLIATAPHEPGSDPVWRISVATVTDGAPFSSFPGYERTFLPLEAGSITLVSPVTTLEMDADGAGRFPGGEAVHALVPRGEALALNVMTIPGRAESQLRRRLIGGGDLENHPAACARITIRGTITTADGATVAAPAIVPPGIGFSAVDAEVIEVLIRIPTDDTESETT